MTLERFIFNRELEKIMLKAVSEDILSDAPSIEELYEDINRAWAEYDNRHCEEKRRRIGIKYAIKEFIDIDFPSINPYHV